MSADNLLMIVLIDSKGDPTVLKGKGSLAKYRDLATNQTINRITFVEQSKETLTSEH